MYKRIEDFPGLVAQLESMFGEMDSYFTVALRENDEEYAMQYKRKQELTKAFPFIDQFLEGDDPQSLSVDKHEGLKEYLDVYRNMEHRERLNLYYAGHRDCFNYLRRIGVI